jgi:hypothetical protein
VFADQLHIPRAVCQRVVDKVPECVLQSLPIRRNRAPVGVDRDHPVLKLGSATTSFGHFLEQIAQLNRLPLQAEALFICRRQ